MSDRCSNSIGVLVVLLALAAAPSTADACTCVTGPYTCPLVAEADAVFEATVESIESRERPGPDGRFNYQERLVHLSGVQGWRGQAQDVVRTGAGGGDCGYEFRVGTRYVIVANRSVDDGGLVTSICSMTGPLAEAGGLREYIQSLSAPSRGGHVWGRVATWSPPVSGSVSPEWAAQPIAAAQVSVNGPARKAMTTGPDGQFNFTALPPGEYLVSVSLPPDRRELIDPRRIKLDRPYACAALYLWPRPAEPVAASIAAVPDPRRP